MVYHFNCFSLTNDLLMKSLLFLKRYAMAISQFKPD